MRCLRSWRDLLAIAVGYRAAIADGSSFLGYGPDSPLHLLLHAIRHRDERRHEQLRNEIADGIRVLDELLQVEAAKTDAETAGDASPEIARIDTSKLSSMLEQRAQGSIVMEPERRARRSRRLGGLEPPSRRCEMKLFGIILKGYIIVWVPITCTLVALLAMILEFRTALISGGIAGTLIAGLVTYLVVESKAKEIRRTHPEFRKPRPPAPPPETPPEE